MYSECTRALVSAQPPVLLFEGLGTTSAGATVDLRVANKTEYRLWNSQGNGLAQKDGVPGEWGQLNLMGNEPSTFEFCFAEADAGSPLSLDEFRRPSSRDLR